MSLTNDQITAKNFKEFYEAIRPYLNGSFPTTIANKFDKANMYSTDEQIVGRWIDGKPLYQKTVDMGNQQYTYNADTNILTNDPIFDVMENCVYCDMLWHFEDANNKIFTKVSDCASSNIMIFLNLKQIHVRNGNFGTNDFKQSWVILQYTKTTDTAMDIGSDTDYSTTEKIVGTWIDGKPLYQKTFTIASMQKDGYKDVLTNVDHVHTVEKSYRRMQDAVDGDDFWYKTGAYVNIRAVSMDDGTLRISNCSSESTLTDIIITAQYTKTTD